MSSVGISALEAPCRALFAALGSTWGWDGRSSTVVLSFPRAQLGGILTRVSGVLGGSWTADTLHTAPARVQCIAEDIGGLRPGQSLLAAATPVDSPALFGALWPWGDGVTMSLRLGYSVPGLSNAAREANDALLKSWFAVAD